MASVASPPLGRRGLTDRRWRNSCGRDPVPRRCGGRAPVADRDDALWWTPVGRVIGIGDVDRQAPLVMASEKELPLRIGGFGYARRKHLAERRGRHRRRAGAAARADDADDRAAVADVVVQFFQGRVASASWRKSLCTRTSVSRDLRSAASASRAEPNSLDAAERKMRKSAAIGPLTHPEPPFDQETRKQRNV